MDLFERGASAEQIAEEFDSLSLADVYAVLGYYLHHKVELDAHLAEKEAEARSAEKELLVRFSNPVRERLLRLFGKAR